MRHILPIRERDSVDRGLLFAQRRGNDAIDRSVDPGGASDRREDCLGAIWRKCRPGPVGEDTAVERLKGYSNGCIFVQGSKARAPKLPTRSTYGPNAWLEERYRPWFDSQTRQKLQVSTG